MRILRWNTRIWYPIEPREETVYARIWANPVMTKINGQMPYDQQKIEHTLSQVYIYIYMGTKVKEVPQRSGRLKSWTSMGSPHPNPFLRGYIIYAAVATVPPAALPKQIQKSLLGVFMWLHVPDRKLTSFSMPERLFTSLSVRITF